MHNPLLDLEDARLLASVLWARENIDKSIEVPDMARQARMERTAFYRAFKSAVGLPPIVWLRTERVETAKRMIEASHLTLEDISRACGFTRPQAFARTFRDNVGVSPREYRRTARAEELASSQTSRSAAAVGAYPESLRREVVRAVDKGVPLVHAAELFDVHPKTVRTWLRRRREGRDLAPTPVPPRKPTTFATDQEREALWEQLENHSYASLERHCELWEQNRGVRVSRATMARAVNRLGWTKKNKRWRPPRGTGFPSAPLARP